MKHLVLGSSGQIGAHLVNYLQSKGEQVYEFDLVNKDYQDLRVISNAHLDYIMDTCDIVHFLAFDVGGAKYLEKYQDTYSFIFNNMMILTNTFEKIKSFKKPFIFASSQMAEMGYSSYGMLKSLGEKMTHDMGGIVARFWNVYGYETNPEKSHVITDFIKMAKNDGVIKMRTDGTESRQFLYADDASEALLTLAKNYDKINKNKNYSITSFEWTKIYEIANILDVLSSCKVFPGDKKDQTQLNAMNKPNDNIKKYWQPKTSLEEGIMKLYNLY
jgi:nucleoside-diphosphate-sugar epimerase|tara:strand:- start:1601 stop:2419 length:819 start_codon:yes stop_codon:yes gene_type:complete